MDNPVEIKLEYHGYFRTITQKKDEMLAVSPCLTEAILTINEFLHERYNIKGNYVLLANDVGIIKLMNENGYLTGQDDKVKVIPMSSGG